MFKATSNLHLSEDMKTTDTETSFELNLAVLKFKHTVKRKPE